MKLSASTQHYILHWGEMGTRWGVNRTVAQIHALLYLSGQPLTAEDIAATLDVARSNVSNSLKELQNWGLARVVHVVGDRRDHFVAHQDIWDIFRVVMDERKKRELDPTLGMLRECVAEAGADPAVDKAARARMQATLELMETVMRAYDDFRHLPPATVKRLLKMGGKIARLLDNGKETS
jgi:DNA-binding transcriptional regulator GbsR (MarR family)